MGIRSPRRAPNDCSPPSVDTTFFGHDVAKINREGTRVREIAQMLQLCIDNWLRLRNRMF